MPTSTKFSEDIVPLSDMKVNPGRVVNQVDRTRRPVLLTNRGRGVAVVQSLKDYETETDERAFLRNIVQGLMDLEEGREMNPTVSYRLSARSNAGAYCQGLA